MPGRGGQISFTEEAVHPRRIRSRYCQNPCAEEKFALWNLARMVILFAWRFTDALRVKRAFTTPDSVKKTRISAQESDGNVVVFALHVL